MFCAKMTKWFSMYIIILYLSAERIFLIQTSEMFVREREKEKHFNEEIY